MSEQPPRDFGAYLRETREARGISLRQIAASTKISVHALEALERNDVSRLPGGIFTRAFVRAYAREVGLDQEQTVRLFVSRFQGQADGVEPIEGPEVEGEPPARSPAALAGVAVLILAVILYFFLGRNGSSDTPETLETPSTSVQETPLATGGTVGSEPAVPPQSEPPEPSAAPAIEAPAVEGTETGSEYSGRGLLLVVRATGDCWVSARIDGKRSFSRLLKIDERVEIEADEEIVLKVGDAGSFVYTLNGAAGRQLGPPGSVANERMTVHNYRSYLADPSGVR